MMKYKQYLVVLLLTAAMLLASCGGERPPGNTEAQTEPVTSSAADIRTEATEETEVLFLRVLSQNLRNANDSNGNSLRERRPRFAEMMEEFAPDLVGTQETTADWAGYLRVTFEEDYATLGWSRDGENATSGERNTIMYRKDRFDLLDSGTFWLTDTPEKVSAVSGAKCNRICTWALLQIKNTDVTVVFCNTHLDHSNDTVRNVQAGYLIEGLKEYIGNYPVFLTGDFNTKNTSEPYRTITKVLADSHRKAEKKTGATYTYHNYGASHGEIDFVFFDPAFAAAKEYHVVNEDYGGYVSDHYGVLVDFVLD